MQVSLYPFLRKRGGLVQVSFKSIARFSSIHQMALLLSKLSAAMENDIIAVI